MYNTGVNTVTPEQIPAVSSASTSSSTTSPIQHVTVGKSYDMLHVTVFMQLLLAQTLQLHVCTLFADSSGSHSVATDGGGE